MAEEELKMKEGGKKSKLIIIIVAVAVLIAGVAYYFLKGDGASTFFNESQSTVQGEEASGPARPQREQCYCLLTKYRSPHSRTRKATAT